MVGAFRHLTDATSAGREQQSARSKSESKGLWVIGQLHVISCTNQTHISQVRHDLTWFVGSKAKHADTVQL